MVQIKTANVSFNENGAPFSQEFDDIYFDSNQGCSQSVQVFIEANNIPQVWHEHSEDTFVIVETGFGTGLNFLLTLDRFIKFKQQTDSPLKLQFISTEKFPLSKNDLTSALALWPEYAEYSNELLKQYELHEQQQTFLFADSAVTLTILFSDSTKALASIEVPKQGIVDCFYLDGFSPVKNPEMWNKGLFLQLARIAKTNATLATFTVAGIVRRGLEEVGFKVSKLDHDKAEVENSESRAEKSQSLIATYVGLRKGKPLTGFKVREKVESSKHATIIGGGLASACAAFALAKKGIKVTLLCQDEHLAQGASSNAIGAIYPLLHQNKDPISDFYQQGFERSMALYQELLGLGYNFSHGFNGLIEVSYKDALVKRQTVFAQKQAWPENLIQAISAKQVNAISGVEVNHPGLYMPRAGWVCPPELVNAIIQAAIDTGKVKVKNKRTLLAVKALKNDRWLITTQKGQKQEQKQVQNLIICTGADSLKIDALNDMPLSIVRGQVSQMKTNAKINNLKTVLCHKGYLTPENNNVHCIGATFDKDDSDLSSRSIDDSYNIEMLERCLGDIGQWTSEDVKASKARLRCCTPDHLPIVGRIPNIDLHKQYYAHLSKDKNWHYQQVAPLKNGLYVLTGLGARGLCSAPLLADILAAEICNDDYPVDEEMLFNLSPNRFIIRDLIKSKS
ncbi:bifunctional tRNA (5-methylaminomethyl-2-thiouridine)(34)-methyltransferase MnmD/FAD-dependent 5-carboxymethylaminomethyl-2-thiouridine(34) oxidoreductase MnmC [Thalassotalea psychrophila]|uniref:tRNA 5-methylaminomethyl-2-thiouridine biosynthesis bifunctional protein MnmC n=1 Tax=Thalassotalea psychrophila TaxID=3065647 RepID=A0ABY9TXK2_9GAMM|nr:bifunctional tRNA (5-methylaminomethyl-2-thiouridine)(34)-methyltransferase MnmD/FAD-dependent 5-carboxymethylaminomethyl-2-thiouridine(34) oxidoreductase MnmC [Colwelliaceae bacterium SQ149]